jgi:hypothetical protein
LFGFIEFLRVVAIGFITLILFGITFYKSVFNIEASWIFKEAEKIANGLVGYFSILAKIEARKK